MNNIGVLGCGWLGLPLAKHLIQNGYSVKGTTTTAVKIDDLKHAGIDAYLIAFTPETVSGNLDAFLQNLDILILNIPPRLRKNPSENFVQKIQLLVPFIKKSSIKKVLFVSSTSVYGDIENTVTEDSIPNPNTASGKQLLATEKLLNQQLDFETTIIRFGGLIGGDRHPIKQLSKKKQITNGGDFINLIHLNDCIALIAWIIAYNKWGLLINGVYPFHPTKKAYYTEMAIKLGFPTPDYQDSSSSNSKIITTQFEELHTAVFKTPINQT